MCSCPVLHRALLALTRSCASTSLSTWVSTFWLPLAMPSMLSRLPCSRDRADTTQVRRMVGWQPGKPAAVRTAAAQAGATSRAGQGSRQAGRAAGGRAGTCHDEHEVGQLTQHGVLAKGLNLHPASQPE